MEYDRNNPNNKKKPPGYKPWKKKPKAKTEGDRQPNDQAASDYKMRSSANTPFGVLPGKRKG